MNKRTLLPLWLLVFIFLVGCANKECYENQNTLPLAQFYDMATKRQVSLSGVTVFGVGAPGDSLIASSAELSEVYLPFRSEYPNTSFVFHYTTEGALPADTVTFCYTTKPWFASEQCGVVYYFYVDSIYHTRHLIDSVAVPGQLITNANSANIQIYLAGEESEL